MIRVCLCAIFAATTVSVAAAENHVVEVTVVEGADEMRNPKCTVADGDHLVLNMNVGTNAMAPSTIGMDIVPTREPEGIRVHGTISMDDLLADTETDGSRNHWKLIRTMTWHFDTIANLNEWFSPPTEIQGRTVKIRVSRAPSGFTANHTSDGIRQPADGSRLSGSDLVNRL